MKRKIFLCSVFFVFASISSFAQQPMMQASPMMMQHMKQQLKDSVGLSEAQADSVIAIRQEFMPQMKQAMSDQSGNREQEIQSIRDAQKARLSTILTSDQMMKLDAFNKNMMARRMQREQPAPSGGN